MTQTHEGALAIQTLLDKQALTELIAVLSSAVDRGDHDRIVSCHAEESFDDHGSFKGPGREFADLICSLNSVPGVVQHHLLGQSIFDLRGDEAYGETFFVFHAAFDGTPRPRSAATSITSSGSTRNGRSSTAVSYPTRP